MKKFKISAIERAHYVSVIEADTEEEAENKFYEKYDEDELDAEEMAIEEIEIEEIE